MGIKISDFFKKFALIIAVSAACTMPAYAAVSEDPVWHADNADISVCRTEFSDFYEIGSINPKTGQYDFFFETESRSGIRFVMIDGGFIKNFKTLESNGIVFVPVESFAELIGIEATYIKYDSDLPDGMNFKGKNRSLTVPNTETEEAVLNGKNIVMPSRFEKVGNELYAPLRFMVETFDGTVQYIPDFMKTFMGETTSYPKIDVIVIETCTDCDKTYTSEDGLKVVKDMSVKKHNQVTELIKLRGCSFGEDGTLPDYDPLDISYTGFDMGRYYVYTLKDFKTMPIFFNKYTGEVYGYMSGRPFLYISKGFPNLNSIY